MAATPQSLQREQAARPRHLVAYLQYLQGGLPDALAALSFAIITAIPFAWLVWRQLPLRPEFARTVVAGSVAFLILHFMIRVGTVLRFPIEELQLREWFGLAYPQWITLGTYYPYLAVGAVLLLTPVYHAQRKAAVASQPLRRGIEAGLLLLTIVVSILFVAISVASANPRGPDSALLAWAENPWILAAVAAAILWVPLRLSVSVLLRVPLGSRAAFVASCGMLLLPIIPHVIEWLSNLAAAAFVQRFNAYPPFIPQQPAATWWRWMVTLLGGFLLFEVVRVAGTMTQLRPIARFFHSRRSALLLPLFMLMAIPAWYAYAQPTEAGRPPDLYDFSQFAHRVDVLLPYLIIPAIVVTIRRLNWQDSFVVPPEVRSLGALLFAFYLCGQAANLFFVPLPMLIGLLLFHFLVRKTLAGPAARLSPEVIRAVLRVRHADALTRERQRVIDKKFQQTDLTSLQYDGLQNENALFVADSQSHLKAKAGVVDVPIFSMGPARGPFRNAMHALRYGLVLSVPLQIATVIRILQQPIGDFPLLDVALAIVRSVSLWGLIAFVFGYFFHLIRGSNGFEKALVFSIAVIIPSVSIRLVQASSVLDQGHMVELIQVTGYLLALSLIAFDVKVLSRASIAWRELPTAYGLTTLTAYVLTLAVSVLSSFVAKEFAPWFYKLVLQAVGVDSK